MLWIAVVWLMMCIIGIGIRQTGFGKIVLTAWSAITLFIVLFIAASIFLWGSKYPRIYEKYLLVLFFIIFLFLVSLIWGIWKKKLVWMSLIGGLTICLGVLGGHTLYLRHRDAIPTVEEENILVEYAPYGEESKVVVLDEEPQLRLEEDLPRLDGATALYPVYSAFARMVYPKEVLENKENEYLVCNTTGRAYERIVDGKADMIFAAAPSEEQRQYARERGVELEFMPIGREAFVFFVNAKNPLKSITVEQIQDIYSGKITRWEELGIRGLGKIKAFQREAGSGSQSAMERLMQGKTLIEAPQEDVVTGMGGIINMTADYKNFKNALGFSFRFYSTEMVKNNQIHLLSLNGVSPTLENIENGTYPIASEFYAVTRSDASQNTRRLLAWVTGEQAQRIIEETGYTPIGIPGQVCE